MEKITTKHFTDKWQTKWQTYQKSHERDPTAAQAASLSKKDRLDLHAGLAKEESALATQIRSEKKIGFAQSSRVPAVTSSACDCGWHSQAAEHVIRHFNLRPDRQRMLEKAGTLGYRNLISRLESSHQVGDEIRPGPSQFSLATQHLYQCSLLVFSMLLLDRLHRIARALQRARVLSPHKIFPGHGFHSLPHGPVYPLQMGV